MTETTTFFSARDLLMRDYFTSTIPAYDSAVPKYKPIRKTSQPLQRNNRSVSTIRINDTNKSTIFNEQATPTLDTRSHSIPVLVVPEPSSIFDKTLIVTTSVVDAKIIQKNEYIAEF
jgi:hypothetical protein